MDITQNKLSPLLFTRSLHEIPFEDLEEAVLEYPYFPVANFLLAKKMKQENNPGFLLQAQKTALYFTNPLWLQYQLAQEDVIDKKEIETEASSEVIPEITLSQEAETTSQNEVTVSEIVVPEQIIAVSAEEPDKKEATELHDEVIVPEEIIPEKIEEVPSEDLQVEKEIPSENIEEPITDQKLSKLSEMLKEHASDFKKPVDDDEKLPSDTAKYHTIDYFASQGIKLNQQAQDKLGIKVRRFTDWLKQMKSINPQPADLGTDPVMEHKVQDNAASSNEPKEVLTESMAEVLAKQGKIDQAVQLYIKLSFLNPHKSAYFATQIENLKGL